MAIGLSSNQVFNVVNNVFKSYGLDPYSTSTRNELKTTTGVRNTFGVSYVSARTLKDSINDPENNVALSLKDSYHPSQAAAVASYVAYGLDGADGHRDGWVPLTNRGAYADVLRYYTGPQRDGYISTAAIQWGLQTGRLVI